MIESVGMTASDPHLTLNAIWRDESPKLIAGLASIVRDIGLAEDLAHDAFVTALEQWPGSGPTGSYSRLSLRERPAFHGAKGDYHLLLSSTDPLFGNIGTDFHAGPEAIESELRTPACLGGKERPLRVSCLHWSEPPQ
jgi:hypothetical protein